MPQNIILPGIFWYNKRVLKGLPVQANKALKGRLGTELGEKYEAAIRERARLEHFPQGLEYNINIE